MKMMEVKGRGNQYFRIAPKSRLPVLTAICAELILFFEFCTINIINGDFMFTFRFPLHFAGSLFDFLESVVVVAIPLLMLICTYFFSKRNLRMLIWPPVLFVIRILVKAGYLCVYEGHFTIKDTWLDLLTYLLLLLSFALTVYGQVRNKWLLPGACALFAALEIAKLFVPAASYAFVVGTSIYLSTFLSTLLFFVGYGILGLALEKR